MAYGRLFATLLGARAFAVALRDRLGWPRCHCAAHGGVQLPSRVSYPACTCSAAQGAGVDLACPYVTARHVRIRKHPTLSLYFVHVDLRAWAVMLQAERDDCADRDSIYDDQPEQD